MFCLFLCQVGEVNKKVNKGRIDLCAFGNFIFAPGPKLVTLSVTALPCQLSQRESLRFAQQPLPMGEVSAGRLTERVHAAVVAKCF